VRIDHDTHKPKNAKVGQTGRGLGQVTNLYNFYTLYYVYRTAKDTNFKFGAQIGHKEYYQKNAKLGQIDE